MRQRLSILRSSFVVALATIMSRILGFVRDIAIANFLGAGVVMDIFVVAFRLPNLFRRFFAEGAFQSAFLPIFSGILEKDNKEAARDFAEQVLSVLLCIIIGLTILVEIFMPQVISILAHGFVKDEEKFLLTVLAARFMFPYLLFVSLMSLYAGILNTQGRFFLAAFVPALLNIILIVFLLIAVIQEHAILPYLISGVLISGVFQFLFLYSSARRIGFGLKLRLPSMNKKLSRLFKIALPAIFAAGVAQINLLIGTNIASAQEGANSWLYYADRLYQLPLGVVGIGLSVALLPSLSKYLHMNDFQVAKKIQSQAVELAILLTIPTMVGFLILADPLISVLFERGSFGAEDTANVALALRAFSPGIVAFVLIKVLQSGFFARGDTQRPFVYSVYGVVINIIVSVMLFPYLGHVAIAIATTLAGWVTLLFMGVYSIRMKWVFDKKLIRSSVYIVLASCVMGMFLLWLPSSLPQEEVFLPFWLGGRIICAVLIFFITLFLSGGMKWQDVAKWFR